MTTKDALATPPPTLNQRILRLAVPALAALLAEPLFLLSDLAIVGHLGTGELAGVGLASVALQTTIGLLVFLSYSVTPAVARLFGSGSLKEALALGRDSLWLAVGLGAALASVWLVFADQSLKIISVDPELRVHAFQYLIYSLPGLPAMLVVLAGAGVLRGLQDAKTPLLIAAVGFGGNIGLNGLLVYGFNLSVAGSALGTSVAQWGMAASYVIVIANRSRSLPLSAGPRGHGVLRLCRSGGWLFLRSVTLRFSILATVWVATGQGVVNLAAHQLAMTIFTFFVFTLDAIAVAAQSLIGLEAGAGSPSGISALARRLVAWGTVFGVATGGLVALIAPWIGWAFTVNQNVHQVLATALLAMALGQPLAGYVFVLDGILMGSGDVRYLGLAGIGSLAVYLLYLLWLGSSGLNGRTGMFFLWLGFALVFMLSRALTLWLRIRTGRWVARA